jgi:hypothetical protein
MQGRPSWRPVRLGRGRGALRLRGVGRVRHRSGVRHRDQDVHHDVQREAGLPWWVLQRGRVCARHDGQRLRGLQPRVLERSVLQLLRSGDRRPLWCECVRHAVRWLRGPRGLQGRSALPSGPLLPSRGRSPG